MNEYSKKSLFNLGIFILIGLLIASFAIVCYYAVRQLPIPFVATILPVVTMGYGAVVFVNKYLIRK